MSFWMSNMWSEITEKHGKQPTSQHLGIVLVLLCVIGGGLVGYFKSIRSCNVPPLSPSLPLTITRPNSSSKLKSIIQYFGVQLHKVARTAMEIERKIFHLTGHPDALLSFIPLTLLRPLCSSLVSNSYVIVRLDTG